MQRLVLRLYPADVSNMADAQPTVVTALNMHNDLVIEITSASGTGKKQYTVPIDGDFD